MDQSQHSFSEWRSAYFPELDDSDLQFFKFDDDTNTSLDPWLEQTSNQPPAESETML